MTKTTVLLSGLLALPLSASLAFAKAPAPSAPAFNTPALDALMIKNCSALSTEAVCQAKLQEIRQGLDWGALGARAPKLPIDAKIQVKLVNDPQQMVGDSYCWARFARLIPEKDFGADLFAYAVQTVSFERASEKAYREWLAKKAGRSCLKEIAQLKIASPSKKQMPLTGEAEAQRPYLLLINPIAFFESGAEEDFTAAVVRTYNNERLHIAFNEEKAEGKVLALWSKLTPGQQQQFKAERADLDPKDTTALLREFFSSTFERQPQKAYDLLAGPLEQTSPEQLQKDLCPFCVAGRDEILATAKELSQLAPKELLARIEKDGVKVLILSAGRKNPSPLFNWGKIRVDEGTLNQITKYESAMGKTLCRGERPEAKDGVTIILAADSPYSTLVHEYLHVLQVRRDPSWCPISVRLWGKDKLSALENRMVRDREWDVRLVLWQVMNSPQLTVEDRLMVADGLLGEGEKRKSFDPAAATFMEKNEVIPLRNRLIKEYMAVLGIKSAQ